MSNSMQSTICFVVGMKKRYSEVYYHSAGIVDSHEKATQFDSESKAKEVCDKLHIMFPDAEQKDIRVRKVESYVTTRIVEVKANDE